VIKLGGFLFGSLASLADLVHVMKPEGARVFPGHSWPKGGFQMALEMS
jgi:hypothetical protein